MVKKIRHPGISKGARFSANVSEERETPQVLFSFRHIQPGQFCFSAMNHKQKGDFADALFRRKDFTWRDLYSLDHRKLGVEQLPAEIMKTKRPACLTEDVDKFSVIRFSNADGRIVGFRKEHIFYILWIDCNFELYDHGS
ncbi:MAG: hypothetical protein HGA83_06435 [Bacteroidales bacterium]|nr:hypothetical protein [Bacteroidales bacterium]